MPQIFIDLSVYNGHTIPQQTACDEGTRVKGSAADHEKRSERG